MKKLSRRQMLKISGTGIAAAAGSTILGLPISANVPQNNAAVLNDNPVNNTTERKGKVLVIGAHPDDPETGCGGTMILLSQAGYEVVSVYLTKGEAGIAGKSHDEAAAIRFEEAKAACKLTGARPVFLSQIDGSTEITQARYDEMFEVIKNEKPDIVLTHWPIDTHRDHRICSLLAFDAWKRSNFKFRFYYFEVMSGRQSKIFHPTDYVDISSVAELKRKACDCHVSQHMDEVYEWHGPMEKFRGMEAGCAAAEAFVQLNPKMEI